MNYTPLRVKTSYSILSSLNNIKKLVSLAKEYGYKSLAITDENNMFGVMEFYLECKKNNIKPIIGIELTISNTILLLYSKNLNGYKNLKNKNISDKFKSTSLCSNSCFDILKILSVILLELIYSLNFSFSL